jgi:FixJ family two-component response regulator
MNTATILVSVFDDSIQNEGWQAALFESAQEFLTRLPTVVPSCLILDVNLPDLSGLDIQQRISDEKFSTPIIFITGYGDIPTSVRAMKAGAAEFLTKPLDDEIMIGAIRDAVLRSQANLKREGAQRQLQERFTSLTPGCSRQSRLRSSRSLISCALRTHRMRASGCSPRRRWCKALPWGP